MNNNTKGILNGVIASVSYGMNPLFALPLYAQGIEVNSVLFYRYFFRCSNLFSLVKMCKKDLFKNRKVRVSTIVFLGNFLFALVINFV